MANSIPYTMEDPKKSYKVLQYPQKAKGLSFFAFIFSIFVYISIFYVFNLSPSSLVKTSKFWFFISNTLILIIAADYGAFSSSGNKHQDAYDEYSMHSEARRVASPPSSFASEYQEIAEKPKLRNEEEEEKERENIETPEKKIPQVVAKQAQNEDIQEKRIVHLDNKKFDEINKVDYDIQTKRSTYRRSNSEKAKRVVIDETKNSSVVLRRSETRERQEINDHVEEMNEFSAMSDEDLNRRVEEFIQRFNRQIRLQAREYDN